MTTEPYFITRGKLQLIKELNYCKTHAGMPPQI